MMFPQKSFRSLIAPVGRIKRAGFSCAPGRARLEAATASGPWKVSPEKRLKALEHAVRPRVLARYGGQLAITVALLNVVPLVAALFAGAYVSAAALAGVVVLLACCGWLGRRVEASEEIQANEALVLAAAAFVLTPLALTWPLSTFGLAPIDAWFEAVSAVTTTGLSTIVAPEQQPWPLLLTRSWMQWYGGLGFAVLCVVLLVPRGLAARRLLEPSGASESNIPSMTIHARKLFVAYLTMSVIGWLALWLAERDGLAALLHTLSGVSTGGFSSLNASLAGFRHPASAWLLSLITLAAAVSLPLYLSAARGNWHRLATDPEFRALLLMTLAFAAGLTAILAIGGMNPVAALKHGFLLGISSQTTSGFSSIDPSTLPDAAKWTSILSMTVGGSVGSTAGGIKLLRLLVLLRVVQLLVRRVGLPPHAIAEPRINGRALGASEVLQILAVPTLFLVVVTGSIIPFLIYGYVPIDALFEVVSATGTVGLSTGITGSDLPGVLKTVLAFDMLAGRLEFIALLVVLSPYTWIGKRYEIA
jgi:trk system potassium uptake protein TrkH